MPRLFQAFFRLESSGAIMLFVCAILALILSNSPLSNHYNAIILETQVLHVTNEGFMTIFFLLVGLEIKYELCYGALNSLRKALLPGIAATGGMLVPALIYVSVNYNDAVSLKGWAIPTATDIAFSLGILTLLGSRIPVVLKIFLMALAIFDDLAAIVVIAVFYTDNISVLFLGLACLCVGVLILLNIKKVHQLSFYGLLGAGLWFCLFKSGIHPTLAGCILAFLVPLRSSSVVTQSPAYKLRHFLHPWVAFGILPLFAFANAGVSFLAISFNDLELPVVIGIFLGLVLGKPIGILGFCWLSVKLRLTQLPEKMRWFHLYAISILCGIGFTISLFIGTLAFGDYSSHLSSVKIGVLLGSFLSGLMAYVLLLKSNSRG